MNMGKPSGGVWGRNRKKEDYRRAVLEKGNGMGVVRK
jgi:hypothetical protein